MVELRKRKAPSDSIPAQEKKAKPNEKKSPKETTAEQKKQSDDDHGPFPRGSAPKTGDTLPLDGFGGEIQTHEGVTTSLKALVDASKSGVVLFTYPKASTPGCRYTVLFHVPFLCPFSLNLFRYRPSFICYIPDLELLVFPYHGRLCAYYDMNKQHLATAHLRTTGALRYPRYMITFRCRPFLLCLWISIHRNKEDAILTISRHEASMHVS